MLGVDQGAAPPATSISKSKQLLSTAMKRTSEWYMTLSISMISVSSFLWFMHPMLQFCAFVELLPTCCLPASSRFNHLLSGYSLFVSLYPFFAFSRIYSQESPSDIEVKVGGAILPLHKVVESKSSYMMNTLFELRTLDK